MSHVNPMVIQDLTVTFSFLSLLSSSLIAPTRLPLDNLLVLADATS